MGVCLDLAYPTPKIRDRFSLRHSLSLNAFADAILRTVYHASAVSEGLAAARRKIIFTSFSPDACAAVNWKQPNCTCRPVRCVFF
jgi:CDK inhibitor PHO81